MASPFESALGLYQGRIRPTGWSPDHGEFVFCLGYDLPGQVVRIAFGDDAAKVGQSPDVSSSKLVRFVVHERAPTEIPAGQEWVVETLLDGSVVSSESLTEGRARTRRDLALDVSALTGAHPIAVLLRAAGAANVDAELPGVYVDALRLTTSEAIRPTTFSRDPEPNDTDVPLDGTITFDLADLGGAGLAAALDVRVDGVLAISAGALQAPWNASGSQIISLANGVRVALVPPAPWASLSVHTVRVLASTTDGAQSDVSWSFTAADFTPPKLLAAFAPAEDEARLTFDEALGDGATTAANYSLSLVSGAPAVTPGVLSATVEAAGVLLVLDKPQTPNAVYAVTVANVQDSKGNVIAAPFNVAQWSGFVCPKPPGRALDLYGQWPVGFRRRDTGDLRGLLSVFQEIVDLIFCELDRYHERVLDPDTALEVFVDRMLRGMGSPFSFLPLSLTDKRRLLRVLVPLLRRKGTAEGIEDAVRTLLGIDVTVVPVMSSMTLGLGSAAASVSFVLSSGDLAKKLAFDIVSSVLLTEAQRAQMIRIANVMRRGVCHLRNIVEPGGSVPEAPKGLSTGARLSIDFVLV